MDIKMETFHFADCTTTTYSHIKKDIPGTLIQGYNVKIEVSELSPSEDIKCEMQKHDACLCSCVETTKELIADCKAIKLEALPMDLKISDHQKLSVKGSETLSNSFSHTLQPNNFIAKGNLPENDNIHGPSLASRWQCPYCDKVFSFKTNLATHVKEKHAASPPSFTCSHCSKVFSSKQGMSKHVKIFHSASPPAFFACPHCDKVFLHKGGLARHVKRLHQAKQPAIACQHCEKVFSDRSNLATHVKTQHSATPPAFPCHHCCKVFSKKGNLLYQPNILLLLKMHNIK